MVAFAATKVVEAVDTYLVAVILHASSPSSSDWVGSKSVCLSGGGFMSSSSTKTSGGSFTDVAGYFSHEVVSDGTAFLGGQSQLGLLAQFTILAHSS